MLCALPDSLSSAVLFLSFFFFPAPCLPWYKIYRLVFHIITPHGPLSLSLSHTHTHTHNLSSGGVGVGLSFGDDREVESESNSVLLVSTGALEPCYIM